MNFFSKSSRPLTPRRRKILRILEAVLLLVFLFSSVKVVSALRAYREHDAVYEELSGQYVSAPAAAVTPQPAAETPAQEEPEECPWPEPLKETPPVTVDMAAVTAENPDTVGWIYAPDTPVNYPVVQGADNDFYLYHTFRRLYDGYGTIFLDCRDARDFSAPSALVYGHNMQNGSMFAGLMKYARSGWYEEHPALWFFTEETTYKLLPLRGIFTWDKDILYGGPLSRGQLEEWLEAAAPASTFRPEDESVVSRAEHVLFLSTCSNRTAGEKYVLALAMVPVSEGD